MVYRSRRDTLVFDEILYRDRFIKVTPSQLVLDEYYLPFVGPKVIPMEDVEHVWRGLDSDLSLKWWERSLGREMFSRIRSTLGKSCEDHSRRNSLIIDVRGSKSNRVKVSTTKPEAAFNAIKNAMTTSS